MRSLWLANSSFHDFSFLSPHQFTDSAALPDCSLDSACLCFDASKVPATPEMFQYDLDGNLTNDGRWSYWWDGENRLTNMVANTTKGPQLNIRFEYDCQGRRIAKKVWSNIAASGSPILDERYVYDGWNLIAILNPDLSPRTSFTWGADLSGSMQGAGGVGGLLAVNDRANGVHFTAFDGNGNVAALVSAATGESSAQYEYGPFGEVIRGTGLMSRANPFRFSTKYQDDETDLLYYGYRYYSAGTGRWINRDPIRERGGVNIYGFVANAPANSFDLLGEMARGGEMQMYCRQPCEDFRRSETKEGRNVPAGGVVCCGGIKFICTWGADKEKNKKAKEIAQRCLKRHERTHLPFNECNSCSWGPVKPTWKKQDKAACEEELQAHGVSKRCFEGALLECGSDQSCIDSLNAWIKSEETSMSYYRFMCNQFGR